MELKIGKEFKIFYDSVFTVVKMSNINYLKNGKINFQLHLTERFNTDFKEGVYYNDRRIELLESYLKSCILHGVSIVDITTFEKLQTKSSYSAFSTGTYMHPDEGVFEKVIDCVGILN